MTPGIYDIKDAEYHSDCCPEPSLSASLAIVLCNDSPAHAMIRHPRLTDTPIDDESTAMDIGTVAHALMLQGLSIAEVLDFPDWRTKEAKQRRDAIREAGGIPILAKNWKHVEAMVRAAHQQLERHMDASDAFTGGKAEQALIWQDSGVWCRSKLDWLRDDRRFVDDYKTTGNSANPEIISKTLFGAGWDVQAAFYLRGLKAIEPNADPVFRFVVQEVNPPYALSVIALGPDALMIGEKKVQFAIDTFRECLQSGDWPGYPRRTCYATLPAWQESRWLQKEMTEHELRATSRR